MPSKPTKRRSPGEGGAFSYKTKTGTRYFWKAQIRQSDGTSKLDTKGGFETKEAALADMQEVMVAGRKGEHIKPGRQLLGAYGREVIEGMRIAPQTRASYLKNWRNHVEPYPVAQQPLADLTASRLTTHYHTLERSGRKDYREGGPLSARTVRYMHTVVHSVLRQAVKDSLLARNPADAATPPTASEAQPPEMHPWNADQLRSFLRWSSGNSGLHTAWLVLAMTGMRRGELLALRWRDIRLDAATISIQRSAGVVRVKGEPAQIVEGPAKTKKSRRVLDVDPGTVAVLRAHKRDRGSLALALARDDALVFGDLDGGHRHPERFSRLWNQTVHRAIKDGIEFPPIRLHDLRHTHATLLLSDGEPVKTVSERLGHASPSITLTVYAHVMPGDQKRAASRFADLVGEVYS